MVCLYLVFILVFLGMNFNLFLVLRIYFFIFLYFGIFTLEPSLFLFSLFLFNNFEIFPVFILVFLSFDSEYFLVVRIKLYFYYCSVFILVFFWYFLISYKVFRSPVDLFPPSLIPLGIQKAINNHRVPPQKMFCQCCSEQLEIFMYSSMYALAFAS